MERANEDRPIEQQIADAETELQTMLTNMNAVNDALLVLEKELTDIDVQIGKLRQDKLNRKTELIGLEAAVKKQRNNIQIHKSKLANLKAEYWSNKGH